MSDQLDRAPNGDLVKRALALLDEVEFATNEDAVEALRTLQSRAVDAVGRRRLHGS